MSILISVCLIEMESLIVTDLIDSIGVVFMYSVVCLPLPSGSTLFSDCSASDFERLVLRGGGVCLLNQPSQSNIVSVGKCGNGMLEEGEDCDCGTPQVLSDSPVFLSVLTFVDSLTH